jgi:hypothetical protein
MHRHIVNLLLVIVLSTHKFLLLKMTMLSRGRVALLLALLAAGADAFVAPKAPRVYKGKSSLSMSSRAEANEMMRTVRSQLAENEDADLVMQALRGTNMNDDDAQIQGLEMKLVDVGDGELPLYYDAVALKKFFDQRPLAIATRIFQLTTVGGGVFFKTLLDSAFGRLENNPDLEVQRAGELRDIITSLGPMFIKLGQVRFRYVAAFSNVAIGTTCISH